VHVVVSSAFNIDCCPGFVSRDDTLDEKAFYVLLKKAVATELSVDL